MSSKPQIALLFQLWFSDFDILLFLFDLNTNFHRPCYNVPRLGAGALFGEPCALGQSPGS